MNNFVKYLRSVFNKLQNFSFSVTKYICLFTLMLSLSNQLPFEITYLCLRNCLGNAYTTRKFLLCPSLTHQM